MTVLGQRNRRGQEADRAEYTEAIDRAYATVENAIGNPLSYNNGTAYTFTWQGRFMQTATVGGDTYTFTYNEEGLRLDKTSNSNGK